MPSLKQEDIEKLIKWTGDWRIVFVKSKEDHMKVRNGTPTSGFWDLWREKKDEIKQLGIYVKKVEDEEANTSEWVVTAWAEPSEEEKEKSKEEWQEKMANRQDESEEDSE